MALSIGIDIGGSKLSAVLCRFQGGRVSVLREIWNLHSIRDENAAVIAMHVAIDEILNTSESKDEEVSAIGLSVAGWLGKGRRTVLNAANLGILNGNLQGKLRKRHDFERVTLENDGNATAWAEYKYGAARHHSNNVLISLGTGVGGGVIVNGKILHGSHGLGGELGHIQVSRSGEKCSCGGFGCLETVCSGPAIGRMTTAIRDGGMSPWLQSNRAVGNLTAVELSEAALLGDNAALEVVASISIEIGRAVAAILPVLDPDLIVLGGSVGAGLGELLTRGVFDYLSEHPVIPVIGPTQDIVVAQLGPIAAAIGVADLAAR